MANLFTAAAVITANFAGAKLDEVILPAEEAKGKEYKTKVLTGKFPALETEEGVLFESAAIARYIARKNPASGLLGANEHEASQVDQWIDFVNSALMAHNFVIYRATFGWMPVDVETYTESLKALKENLKVLNTHLQGKQFFVGGSITVADIIVAMHVVIPMQIALDPGFRKAMPNLTSWFERVIALPQFVARLGAIKLCQKTIKPNFPPKEEKKAAAKKDDTKEETEAPVKKDVNPLDALPPTKFDLYNFKTFFVNIPDRRGEGMARFFEEYDPEGYSIYFLHYNKYEGEGQVQYQFTNFLNGFLQRFDHFRRHCLAMYCMLGAEPNLEIEGVWMFRGKGIPQEMIDHPQFEYHSARELFVTKEEDRKLITDFWCCKVGESINGQTVVEAKMHK